MNTSELTTTPTKEVRKHIGILRRLGVSEEDFTLGMLEQSTIPMETMIGPITLRATSTALSLRACNKHPSGHQPREAEW
jgi:aspartate/tyrosine/aromatic aminotransferase